MSWCAARRSRCGLSLGSRGNVAPSNRLPSRSPPLEPVIKAWVRTGVEVGREATVVVVADELGELGEDELPYGGEGDAEVVYGDPDGGTLEVATVEGDIVGNVDERVVIHRVDLVLD